MKLYGEVEVQVYAFISSTLETIHNLNTRDQHSASVGK